MEFFKLFSSNTLAGSGNQSYFINADDKKVTKCRILYKIFCGGRYNYALLFSNIIDSTFSDGSHSHRNLVLDSWKIHQMNVAVTDLCDEASMKEPDEWLPVTFDGRPDKTVNPGEFFSSDSIALSFTAGAYLCVEILFSGKEIPYHAESIIPSFVFENGEWIPSKYHPFPSMIGCDRRVSQKIGFLGDSITQGIGTGVNSYLHWNSVFAENVGTEYSYWNLGLGFGRADDAAADGAWLFKAKQCDIIFVCCGVNDILQGYSEDSIKRNLSTIVNKLHSCGKKIILQTVPPFDYREEEIVIWKGVNKYITNILSEKAELVFDCTAILQKSAAEPHAPKYGGHPNDKGCRIWGNELSRAFKAIGI